MGWWVFDIVELFFEDCWVLVENLIGVENGGFFCIMSNFQMECLIFVVIVNMIVQVVLDEVMVYVCECEVFGCLIVGFQVICYKLVEMVIQVVVSWEFIYWVVVWLVNGEDCVLDVFMVKNQVIQCVDWVIWDVVQIFGGVGYMCGIVVEWLFCDNCIFFIGGGIYEIMNEVIVKCLGLQEWLFDCLIQVVGYRIQESVWFLCCILYFDFCIGFLFVGIFGL